MMMSPYTGLKGNVTVSLGTLVITPLPHIQLIKISSLAKNIRNYSWWHFLCRFSGLKKYLSDLLEHIFF